MALSHTIMTTTYTPSQAARALFVSRWTIYKWLESGRLLPVYHLGHPRIPKEQIKKLLLGSMIVYL